MKKIQKMLKPTLYTLALIIMISSITSIFTAPTTYALGCSPADQEARMDFYGSSDVPPFSDPCNSGGTCAVASAGSTQSQLRGGSNAEKVWNYFIGRGLSPIAAAGAMGNIEQESGFDPWVNEGGNSIGFGLIQWSYERRTKVENALRAAGITEYTQATSEKGLLIQLDYLWQEQNQTWEPLKAETKVNGDTSVNPLSAAANVGNGSALYFHASVERSNDKPAQLQERVDSAQAYLDQFGGGASSSGGVVTTSSTNCSGSGGAGLMSGGMDLTKAQALMQEYITSPEVDKLVGEQSGVCGANQGWRANCVTFSKYFLRKFTTIEPAPADGKDVVRNTKATNPGTESGPTPKAYSVFSYSGGNATTEFGHTGVVLAVDAAKGTMIIAEANCNAAGPREVSSQIGQPFTVREAPISGTHPSNVEYLYTDGKLKGEMNT